MAIKHAITGEHHVKHRADLKHITKTNGRQRANINKVCVILEGPDFKQALTKIDLSKMRENVSGPDDYGTDSHSIYRWFIAFNTVEQLGQLTDGSSKDQGWAGGKIWWNQLSSWGSNKQQAVRVRSQTDTTG